MRLFLNSCNIKEIEEAATWPHLGGITMNPTMVAKEKYDFVDSFKTICKMVPDIPVFAQVLSTDPKMILEEGKALSRLGDNVVVKVITNEFGIAGMKLLKDAGIPVCATCVHSVIESIPVGAIGVDHIAVFVGLLGEVSELSVSDLLRNIVTVYREQDFDTKIMIAARSVNQLVEGYMAGAHESTCSYSLFKQFFTNSFTRDRWDAFQTDWNTSYGQRNWVSG